MRRHLSHKGLIRRYRLEISATAQQQGLLDSLLEMAMGAFHTAVFVGHTQIVAAVGHSVVAAQRVMALGDIRAEMAFPVAIGRRQPVRAQFPWRPATGVERILQPF